MYKITHEQFGLFDLVKLINSDTQEWVSVIPAYAATINDLVLSKNSKTHELTDACKCYEELITEGKQRFKGTKLFPFPNRINKGQYNFENNAFQLVQDFPSEGHAIHGLLKESRFEIVKETANQQEASLEVQYEGDGSDKSYPFKYKLTILYSLSAKGFTCATIVENTDTKEIPVGDGWHPYFKTGNKLNDLFIEIPSEQIVEVNNKMIPTGNLIDTDTFIRSTKIATSNFDTCYKLKEKEGVYQVELYDPEKDIKLVVWQTSGKNKYNYVQIYIPPSRDCIAIEPMTCMPDAFNNKNGLITLKPNEIINFAFGASLN